MKKSISFILILSLLLTSFVSYGTSLDSEHMSISEKQALTSEGIAEFEKYFKNNNIDVIEQLNLAKIELLDLIETEEESEEIAKLKKLANSYDLMIEDYKEYTKSETDIIPYGVNDPTYRAAIALIITYFNINGYSLAAELLNHATYYSTGGQQYSPYFGNRAQGTTAYQKLRREIKASGINVGNGSSSFPNSGDEVDRDLYYAVHLYRYSYYGSIFTLTDVYDFAPNHRYNGLAGTAIDLCYMAQNAGVIVPFLTIIKLPFLSLSQS